MLIELNVRVQDVERRGSNVVGSEIVPETPFAKYCPGLPGRPLYVIDASNELGDHRDWRHFTIKTAAQCSQERELYRKIKQLESCLSRRTRNLVTPLTCQSPQKRNRPTHIANV